MKIFVECTKGTKEKWEKRNGEKVLDRMLDKPWIANYGSVLGTLQADGDELDSYIIGRPLESFSEVEALPLCIIYCIDNGVVDNKLVCAAKGAERHLMKQIRRVTKFVGSYKPGSRVLSISWRDTDIRYELAKCRAYANLSI